MNNASSNELVSRDLQKNDEPSFLAIFGGYLNLR